MKINDTTWNARLHAKQQACVWVAVLQPALNQTGDVPIGKRATAPHDNSVCIKSFVAVQRARFINPVASFAGPFEAAYSEIVGTRWPRRIVTKTESRRYGRWNLMRFVNEVGSSQFLSFSERNAAVFTLEVDGNPRQDDYDIWLGTNTFQSWIAYRRHTGVANYLYLDGHVSTLPWDAAVVDMFPDKFVQVNDVSYP